MSDRKRAKNGTGSVLGISRSISLCLRCRNKKIRCSPSFPKCESCEKAGADCVGVDPSTGREVPRSYVFQLEQRIQELELQLRLASAMSVSTSAASTVDSAHTVDLPVGPGGGGAAETGAPVQPDARGQVDPSFSKLVSTAVRMKDRRDTEVDPLVATLNIDESILPAIVPPKKTAQEFLKVFFAQSNAQLPVIHREEFIRRYFVPIYGQLDEDENLASNYTSINYEFIGPAPPQPWFDQYKLLLQHELAGTAGSTSADTVRASNQIVVPPEFHRPLYFLNMAFAISSSVHHLQYLLTISDSFRLAAQKYRDAVHSSPDQLESLQGMLLLASYGIMRPTNPGVWYVLGTALRVCVDLGLHNESIAKPAADTFTRDKRRRLFWCTYALDRQICFYLGRPVGIPEESINTPFPSELDDALIVPGDSEIDYPPQTGTPTYKCISLAMFKIRQIQCEVQRILYENADLPRDYVLLVQWKEVMYSKLISWKNLLPKTQRKMNCNFNPDFFHLNYNHTIIRLFGLSPKNFKLDLDDFHKVAEALKNLIACYHQLYRGKAVNYTWAAVHNLFMAGTSFLYVIYNCDDVRHQNSLFEVKKITQECITVLNSLLDRCNAALSCRDTFEVLTVAVLKLKYNEAVTGNNLNVSSLETKHHHVNSNLVKLLENLTQHYAENGKPGDLSVSIKQELETPPKDPTPDRFEWINVDEVKYDNIINNTDLSVFFDELDNISSGSTGSPRNSDHYGSPKVWKSSMAPSVSREGKKAYEIINQMPNDAIWDEFFTVQSIDPKNINESEYL